MSLGNVRGTNPIHGFLTSVPDWNVVETRADGQSAWVTSRLEFFKHPSWMKQFPFAHTIEMTHRLRDGVLEVATRIDNLSVEPMPVAIGFHPFFQLTDSPRDEWTLSVAARTHWPVSEEKMPTGVTQPIEKFFANPAAVQLAPLELDDVFSDLVRDATRPGDDVAAGQNAAVGCCPWRELSRRRDLCAEAGAGPGPRGAQLCVYRTCRGHHQRAESCPQRRVQRAAEHPSGWCLAGAFLDSSQRILDHVTNHCLRALRRTARGHLARAVAARDHVRRHRASEAGRVAQLQRPPQRKSPQPARSHQHAQRRNARAEVDARDGRQAGASDDAARRRRRHVRRCRQRSARAGRADRPADLAVRRPQTPGLVPTGDPASGINRAIAVLGNRVFLQTDHAHLLALDRRTGQLLWDVEMADYRQNYGATGALLIVNDLVIAGISAGDEGVRGFLDAYRASTGERVWRFWTVPARGEPGSETWIGKAHRARMCDHVADRLVRSRREAAVLADRQSVPRLQRRRTQRRQPVLVVCRRARSRDRKAAMAFSVHAARSSRLGCESAAAARRRRFRGRARKLLVVANRNGFFYVLDRLTGQMLMAEPFVKNITWASGIGADGRPKLLPPATKTPSKARRRARRCPARPTGRHRRSIRRRDLFYVMASEACAVYRKNSDWFEYGKSFYGGTTKNATIEGGGKFLRALDLQTGSSCGKCRRSAAASRASGLMSTAGGLVFYGDNTGGSLDRRRRKDRTASVAVRHAAGLEVESDDLRDRWQAIHRRGRRLDGEGVRVAGATRISGRLPNAGRHANALPQQPRKLMPQRRRCHGSLQTHDPLLPQTIHGSPQPRGHRCECDRAASRQLGWVSESGR